MLRITLDALEGFEKYVIDSRQSSLHYSFNLLDEYPEADTHPVYDRL